MQRLKPSARFYNPCAWGALIIFLSGCSSLQNAVGGGKLNTPPEFNQEVILQVSDDYKMYQAPRSGYDIGDLQAFHSQHTLPIVVEDSFKDIFGKVTMKDFGSEPGIETEPPNVPAIFEVRMMDLTNDNYNQAETYRAGAMIGVAMKSPRGNILWQQAFRGDGYVKVDPQFSTGLGPQDAVVDAVRDAMSQMQRAIISSSAVRAQMKHYMEMDEARKATEQKV
ncbi:MAG: hypothetical protein WCU74_07490 [Candidatus Omnitrophota bacterium]|jgi:hypothetical protein